MFILRHNTKHISKCGGTDQKQVEITIISWPIRCGVMSSFQNDTRWTTHKFIMVIISCMLLFLALLYYEVGPNCEADWALRYVRLWRLCRVAPRCTCGTSYCSSVSALMEQWSVAQNIILLHGLFRLCFPECSWASGLNAAISHEVLHTIW